MLLAITLISTTIAVAEGIPLIKKKMWKELVTLISLIVIAILLVIEKLLDIPTPMNVINNLLYPFGRTIFRIR
jgi:hypothetical protein